MTTQNKQNLTKLDESEVLNATCKRIISTANNEKGSALKCIHQVSVLGKATQATFVAIEQRIIKDEDIEAAYHLALIAQKTADLPVNAKQLIDMVVNSGNSQKIVSLVKNMPVSAVEQVKAKIMASGNNEAIQLIT